MVFVTLKRGESLLLPGCDVSMDVLEIQDGTVRFNICAPTSKVIPGELWPNVADTPKLPEIVSGNFSPD